MGGARGSEVVHAPRQRVIDAMLAYETFPQWQSAVAECEVLERDAEGRPSVVRFLVDAKVTKVGYVIRNEFDLPDGLRWTQVRGDLKRNTGSYTWVDRGDGTTVVTVEVDVDYGFFLPGPLRKVLAGQFVKASLQQVKAHCER